MKTTFLLLTAIGIGTAAGCLPWSAPQRPPLLQAVVDDPRAFQADPPAESVPVERRADLAGCWGSVQRDGPATTSLSLSVEPDGATELAWDIALGGVIRGVVVQRGTLAAEGGGRFLLTIDAVETDGPGGPAVVETSASAPLGWRVWTGDGLLGVEFLNEGGPEAAVGRTLWFRGGDCLVP